MTRDEILRHLERLLEVVPNSLSGNERLSGIPAWDSIAVLAFVTTTEEIWGILLDAEQVSGCQTVNDLLTLVRV